MVSTGQGFLGYNMFAYCNNNPVNMTDSEGDSALLASTLVGAVTGATTGAIAGLTGPLSFAAKITGMAASGLVAGVMDLLGQKWQYNKKVKNGTATGEFKTDVGSAITATIIGAAGSGLNMGLTYASTVSEAIVTGVTGGYFATLLAATVEMVARGYSALRA